MSSEPAAPGGRIASLFSYPVKGLSPQPVDAAVLTPEAYFPDDRIYAVENGTSGFDENAPSHLPKIKFLMLMRNERLARLRTHYDPPSHRLTIEQDDAAPLVADLSQPDGRAAVETYLAAFCRDEMRGAPRVLAARDGFRFTDSPKGFVSFINLASVKALEEVEGRPVDPLRFRGNLYVSGWQAWEENTLVGRRIALGDAVVEVSSPIERCAATHVDPKTGQRDMNLVRTLMHQFGHNLCGLYVRVLEGGTVRPGDALRVLA